MLGIVAGLRIVDYTQADAGRWDAFVDQAQSGTFLHTRKYLSYHGERFTDHSLLLESTSGQVLAVLPAARHADGKPELVVSHPGITFGGLVYDRRLHGQELLDAFSLIKSTYAERGFTSLDYRPVPWFFRATHGEEDIYALFRTGARLRRRHLTSVIDLGRRPKTGPNYLYDVRRASREGVALESGASMDLFWPVLEQELDRRHGTRPVHSLLEMRDLVRKFPHEIKCIIARKNASEVVAGAVLYEFTSAGVTHTQYLASTPDGRQARALHLVCETAVRNAIAEGRRYFSFGASTEDDGLTLNAGLYDFKFATGADGHPLDAYDVDLVL
jgi:hypothetical protein